MYYDPFLAAAAASAATADPNYRLQAAKPMTEVPAQPAIISVLIFFYLKNCFSICSLSFFFYLLLLKKFFNFPSE
uniref:Uncharacterized protein n=1 Tax=Lutzomyia longipalpis TaxID=7200 RepID=A0A1B0CQ12_LUTLO